MSTRTIIRWLLPLLAAAVTTLAPAQTPQRGRTQYAGTLPDAALRDSTVAHLVRIGVLDVPEDLQKAVWGKLRRKPAHPQVGDTGGYYFYLDVTVRRCDAKVPDSGVFTVLLGERFGVEDIVTERIQL